MLDNGLLKYYKEYADSKGRLMVDKVKDIAFDMKITWGVNRYIIDGKSGRQKFFCIERDKKEVDAEVLISQLFPKLGVPSAIYTPAHIDNEFGCDQVLSNNVGGNSFIMAKYLPREKFEVLFSGRKEDVFKHFSPDAIKQILIMQVLDAATCNSDRHYGNFFVKDSDSGKIGGIATFDHEGSSDITNRLVRMRDEAIYKDYLTGCYVTRGDIVHSLKTNELSLSVLNPSELAESIGGTDVEETVRDIKETTGYEVSQKYVSALQQSFEEVAEELEQ